MARLGMFKATLKDASEAVVGFHDGVLLVEASDSKARKGFLRLGGLAGAGESMKIVNKKLEAIEAQGPDESAESTAAQTSGTTLFAPDAITVEVVASKMGKNYRRVVITPNDGKQIELRIFLKPVRVTAVEAALRPVLGDRLVVSAL